MAFIKLVMDFGIYMYLYNEVALFKCTCKLRKFISLQTDWNIFQTAAGGIKFINCSKLI